MLYTWVTRCSASLAHTCFSGMDTLCADMALMPLLRLAVTPLFSSKSTPSPQPSALLSCRVG